MRRETVSFQVRDVGIGSAYPVTIQSMTNTDTNDVEATLAQVRALMTNGAELVRIAVPSIDTVAAAAHICKESPVPIIADIHFDHRIAIACIEQGLDAIRINPGNIGDADRVDAVLTAAKAYQTPLRIGVNSGSIEKHVLAKYGHPCAEAMVESLSYYVQLCEVKGLDKIVLSVKASDVLTMIQANRLAAEALPYPLHLGVTEAGSVRTGVVKSSVGIGSLLVAGIGDTLRVSLTGDPLNELPVAKDILRAVGLRNEGVEIVSCPTCGRTKIDLEPMVAEVEALCKDIKTPLKIAVMGCVVNGPGEAREADLGIAGGVGNGLIFRKGEVVGRVSEHELMDAFTAELNKLLEETAQ